MLNRYVRGRKQNAVTNLLGGFDRRVDRISDADEDRLIGLTVLADHRQHSLGILFTASWT
jgi:hypothetical protein